MADIPMGEKGVDTKILISWLLCFDDGENDQRMAAVTIRIRALCRVHAWNYAVVKQVQHDDAIHKPD